VGVAGRAALTQSRSAAAPRAPLAGARTPALGSAPRPPAGRARPAGPEPGRPRRAQGLKDTVKKLLLAFYRASGNKKPERLVFYRDGVSEGQARAPPALPAGPYLYPYPSPHPTLSLCRRVWPAPHVAPHRRGSASCATWGRVCVGGGRRALGRRRSSWLSCTAVARPVLFTTAPAPLAASARQAGTGVSSRVDFQRCPRPRLLCWRRQPRRRRRAEARPRARAVQGGAAGGDPAGRGRVQGAGRFRGRGLRAAHHLWYGPARAPGRRGFPGPALRCGPRTACRQAGAQGLGRSTTGAVLPLPQRSARLQAWSV
jgi:hypothetical protein